MKPSTGWALVGAQFGLIAALVLLPAGTLWPRELLTVVIAASLIVAGIGIAVSGGVALGSSLTPLPIPRAEGELVTSGVYRFIRHPIYTGLLLGGLGISVWGASLWHFLVFVGLATVLNVKVFYEEKLLSTRYSDYQSYAMTTGRLFPRWRAKR